MWNFQKKLRGLDIKTYTAAEVHADLTAMMLLFLSDIQQEAGHKEVPAPLLADSERLTKLGFRRSQNLNHATCIINEVKDYNREHEKKVATLNFMRQAWSVFGKDTMIVRYGQFLSLLEKYNLVCGSFDRYTGAIPAENLADIERAVAIIEGAGKDMIIPFRYITEVDTDNNSLKWLQWFNLFPMDDSVRTPLFEYMGLRELYAGKKKPSRRSDSEHARFVRSRIQEALSIYTDQTDSPQSYPNLTSEDCNVFIAAPAQEMENFEIEIYSSKAIREYNAWQDRLERERLSRIRTLDPFVCSLTPFGIMIYTKWGAEAEDATIKRYEQLRDTIMKGGN